MTKRQLSDVLDECLTRLTEDGVSVEACLARYPEHAAELRPLLEVVVEMRRMPRPEPSAAAVEAGKCRMLEAVRERQQQKSPGSERLPVGLLARGKAWIARLLDGLQRPVSSGHGFGWQAALATAAALLIVVIGGLLLPAWLGTTVPRTVQLDVLQGGVRVRASDGSDWVPASSRQRLTSGDHVRTDAGGVALLTFFDGSTTALEGGTEVELVELSSRRDGTARAIVLHQQRGRTHNQVRPLRRPSARFQVKTPSAVTMVRGTTFDVAVEADGTTLVALHKGLVDLTFDGTTVELQPGWARSVSPDASISRPIELPKRASARNDFPELPTSSPTDIPTSSPTPWPTEPSTPTPTVTPDASEGSEQPASGAEPPTKVPPTPSPAEITSTPTKVPLTPTKVSPTPTEVPPTPEDDTEGPPPPPGPTPTEVPPTPVEDTEEPPPPPGGGG